MICAFFGHKDTSPDTENDLKNAILYLIQNEGVCSFLVGNNGNFDLLVQKTLARIKQSGENITYCFVVSYLGERALSGEQDATVFPQGLEFSPPRFAISKRNEWLIKQSDIIIAYDKYKISKTHQWVQKAARRGLRIINLAST